MGIPSDRIKGKQGPLLEASGNYRSGDGVALLSGSRHLVVHAQSNIVLQEKRASVSARPF